MSGSGDALSYDRLLVVGVVSDKTVRGRTHMVDPLLSLVIDDET